MSNRGGFFPQPNIGFERGKHFHNLIILLDRLELVPPAMWLLLALAGVFGMTLLWPGSRSFAFVVTLACLAAEAGALVRGNRGGRNLGPFGGPFFLFSIGHLGTGAALPLLGLPSPWIEAAHLAIQLGLLAAMLYASFIETGRVRFVEFRLPPPPAGRNVSGPPDFGEEGPAEEDRGGGGLRFLLISDLHLDRWGHREDRVLEMAENFRPDVIFFPGDFVNLSYVRDPVTRSEMVRFMNRLCELAPVYASRGTPEVDDPEWLPELLAETGAAYLDHSAEVLQVGGMEFLAAGIPYDYSDWEDMAASLYGLLKGADGRPVILVHHSPDFGPIASRLGVWLHVCGHTHGGQVLAPLFGPFHTASRFGRKYAWGSHRIGDMRLVVSRGIGLEGGGTPRMRFLAPPEVVGIVIER